MIFGPKNFLTTRPVPFRSKKPLPSGPVGDRSGHLKVQPSRAEGAALRLNTFLQQVLKPVQYMFALLLNI